MFDSYRMKLKSISEGAWFFRAPFAVFLGIDNGENEAYNIVKRGRV